MENDLSGVHDVTELTKRSLTMEKIRRRGTYLFFVLIASNFFLLRKKVASHGPLILKFLLQSSGIGLTETFSRGYISIYFVNKSKKEKSIEMY